MEVKPALLPAVQLAARAARTCEVMYLCGRDGYTFGDHVKGLISAFFLAPIKLYALNEYYVVTNKFESV